MRLVRIHDLERPLRLKLVRAAQWDHGEVGCRPVVDEEHGGERSLLDHAPDPVLRHVRRALGALGRLTLALKHPGVGLLTPELDHLDVLVEHLLSLPLAAALVVRARRRAHEAHVHLDPLLDRRLALLVEHGVALFVEDVAPDDLALGVDRELREVLGPRLLAVHHDRGGKGARVDLLGRVELHDVEAQLLARPGAHNVVRQEVLGIG